MLDSRSLQLAIENGIISEDEIRLQVEMYEKKKCLDKHEHRIWQGKNREWYTYLPDKDKPKGRRQIKRKKRSDLIDAVVAFYRDNMPDLTIKEVFCEWIDGKLRYGEIKKQTYDRYKDEYARFVFGEPIEKMPFVEINRFYLEDFIKSTIHDKELTQKGWSGLRTILIGIFAYGENRGYTDLDIHHVLTKLQLSKKIFKERFFEPEESVFTEEEVNMIKDYIDRCNPSLVSLGILLAFETGVRSGELAVLQWEDVDLRNGFINVSKTIVRYREEDNSLIHAIENRTKGRDGRRSVALTEKGEEILRQARKLNPFGKFVFFNEKTGKQFHEQSFSRKLKRICESLGIKKRSLHKARKTCATNMLNHNLDHMTIQEQLGHTDISTTFRYYYFNNRTKEERRDEIRAVKRLVV